MLWAIDDIACFLGMVECAVWPTPLTVNLTASWRWQWWHRWSQAPKISAKLAPWTCKRVCWGRSIESLWWGEVGFHLVTWMKVVPVSTKCIAPIHGDVVIWPDWFLHRWHIVDYIMTLVFCCLGDINLSLDSCSWVHEEPLADFLVSLWDCKVSCIGPCKFC